MKELILDQSELQEELPKNKVDELYEQIDLADKIEFLITIMATNCLKNDQKESCLKNKKKGGWKLLIDD